MAWFEEPSILFNPTVRMMVGRDGQLGLGAGYAKVFARFIAPGIRHAHTMHTTAAWEAEVSLEVSGRA